ncbi:hypothetical protein EPO34_04860 [Patescibacteria group bacterium]|nr:MAG: hypothetical protein EPO34_04860 [Patescibacteria group bacterium]
MAAKPTPTYRPLLREALRLTWERKSLWVFGLFASLLSTGGIVDVGARGLRRVEDGSDLLLNVVNDTFTGADTFGAWIRQVELLEPGRVTLTVTAAFVLVLAALVAAFLSQAALIRGLACTDPQPFHHHMREGRPFFWRLVCLTLAGKAAQGVLLLMASLPLVLVVARGTYADGLLFVACFLIAFPLSIIANLVTALAVIDVVRDDRSAAHALLHAAGRFAGHWLAALELGAVAYLAITGLWVIGGAAIILASLPYGALVALALYLGSPVLFGLVTVAFGIVVGAIAFAAIGAATTLQYAVWLRYSLRAENRRSPLVAKLERLWRKW